jgi:hypothetical protein
MTGRVLSIGRALLALTGPMIWAAHFFEVYLAEAVLCSPSVSNANAVRVAGVTLTLIAVLALLWARRRFGQGEARTFARPLIDLSIVAVLLTAIPLALIAACSPAGA